MCGVPKVREERSISILADHNQIAFFPCFAADRGEKVSLFLSAGGREDSRVYFVSFLALVVFGPVDPDREKHLLKSLKEEKLSFFLWGVITINALCSATAQKN